VYLQFTVTKVSVDLFTRRMFQSNIRFQ